MFKDPLTCWAMSE